MARATNAGRVAAVLALAAAAAAVSNLAASTSRKLAWVGSYSRALEVGPPAPEAAALPASSSPSTGSVAAVEPDLARSFPPHPDKPAIEIAPADVLHLYRKKMLFLDARRSAVYSEGHIAGARSFPVWESDIDDRVKKLFEEGLDQRAPVVAYCSGGNCEDSHMLAEKLYRVGFDNVLIYKDGFPDWQKQGLPVSKGVNP
jgi:rhodanese-related sulfurtransferase